MDASTQHPRAAVRAVRTARATVRALGMALVLAAPALRAEPADRLADLSLEQLSALEVTSVSKSAEPLGDAPAAIYVITHDELVRSGVTSLAEALRLAPNLQLRQYSATSYAVGARGFGGAEEAQNFSNKLLILIDGRSVYTPLYSGVYLDAQDLVIDDIDRIEVISGPGATLWGANAMNGVINIITRPSYLSDGGLVVAGAGDDERTASLRYGRRLGETLSYRVYGKVFARDAQALAEGASAGDDWNKTQGGFRLDWSRAADTLSAQGDLYRADEDAPDMSDGRVEGANLLARWTRRTARGSWQLQGYYDYSSRAQAGSGTGFILRTFDVDLQQDFAHGAQHLVWGGGLRVHRYGIDGTAALMFEPDERTLSLANLFAQDSVALGAGVELIFGLKLERDAFVGWSPLPDLRLSWRPDDGTLLWAAASRAVRSPTPFDEDVREDSGAGLMIVGNPDFKTEKVDAYELGYRARPLARLSVSAALFYDVYDDLRTIELASVGENTLVLQWGNGMKGHAYGLEAWAKWQLTPWWRLSPGLRTLHKNLDFKSGSSAPLLLDASQAGNDPHWQALLGSAMDLGTDTTLDCTLRRVGALPEPHLDAYWELQASLQHRLTRDLELSLSGFNLLHARHLEYPAPSGEYIGRSVLAQLRWRF